MLMVQEAQFEKQDLYKPPHYRYKSPPLEWSTGAEDSMEAMDSNYSGGGGLECTCTLVDSNPNIKNSKILL